MKIAFVHGGYYRADRLTSWSGSPYFMRKALEGQGCHVEDILLADTRASAGDIAKKLAWRIFRKKRYLVDRSPKALAGLRRNLEAKVDTLDCDIVLAPSSLHVAALPPGRPAAFWTDACFAGMHGYYESFSRLTTDSLQRGHEVEKTALCRAACAFYSSDWAAETATRAYGRDHANVAVVPFGANLLEEPSFKKVEDAIQERGKSVLRLLFAGVDWKRKGGDFALKIARLARARGIPVELNIVGCKPPIDLVENERWIHCWGFISKSTPEGRRQLEALMLAADWLVLPTRAECYGVVFAEGAAHGLPSLATAVGGVPTAVCRGKNGFVFPLESPAAEWVDVIDIYYNDHIKYRALAHSARAYYLERLNWRVAGESVTRLLEEIVQGRITTCGRPEISTPPQFHHE